MSIGFRPARPDGSDEEAVFMRWVWDSITDQQRVISVQGITTHRKTTGTVQIPQAKQSGGGGGTSAPKIPRWG